MIASVVSRIDFKYSGLGAMYAKFKKLFVKSFVSAAMTVRQFYMGSQNKASLDGVYINPIANPKTISFQDLLITSRLGMIDVTSKYKQRLGFQDPATQLNGVHYDDVWKALCRGVDGMDPKEHGRIEIDFTDHIGTKRWMLISPEDQEIVLPLYRKKQSKLSIGIFKVELNVRRIDVDENGEEISFCSDQEDDEREDKEVTLWITEEFRKWIPNKNVMESDDDTLFRLALRDSVFRYPELYDIFNPPTDREKFKYEASVRVIYSNLSDAHRSIAFDWETFPEGVVVGKSN